MDPWTRGAQQALSNPPLAIQLPVAVGIQHKEIRRECNYCLYAALVVSWWPRAAPGHHHQRNDLHSGFCSSHFFFRFRHVKQPVLVRLLKFLFRFLGSC
jgi:hypothetical protein